MTANAVAHRIRSLSSLVAGRDVESGKWSYVLSPRAVLDDSFASLTLKRKLESGALAPQDAPAGVVVGRVAVATKETVNEALAAAAEAARIWRSAPLSVRFDGWMQRLGAVVRENEDEIIDMLVLEGHPLQLARWEFAGMLELSRPESLRFLRGQLWQEFAVDGRRNIVRRQPDGVVCVNPPANAPLVSALLGVSAIAGGNAVVVRAPQTAPFGISHVLRNLLVPALDELGAPPGILSVLCGHAGSMIDAWIESPHVDDILYFGDVPMGLKIERKCVEAGKKPIMELAGNDAVLVWKDADLDRAADVLMEAFYGSGQICMLPNNVVVHPDVADELITQVAVRAAALRPGYPDQDGVLLSPVLRHDKFNQCLQDAVEKGATVVTGGNGMQLDGTRDSNGFFLEPTVVRIDGLAGARDLAAVEHETFFPLLPVIVPESADDDTLLDRFIEFANTNLYGLRNSLWARDEAVIERFLAAVVKGGLLKVNDSHIAFTAPLASHGGTGLSGGAFGELNYPILRTTHLQGVSVVPATAPDAPPSDSREREHANAG